MSYGLGFVLNSRSFQQKLKSLVLLLQNLSCVEERTDIQLEAEVHVKMPSSLIFGSVLFLFHIYLTF